MALTHKQQRFITAYLRTGNATQAAIEAGYSERSAYAIGYENLNKPEIFAEIEGFFQRELDLSYDRVRREFAALGAASIRDVLSWGVGKVKIGFDADGKRLAPSDIMDAVMVMEVEEPFVRPLNSADLPAHIAAAVSEVSLGKEGFKIKMHSKLDALDKLAKMLGYYAPEKHELTGPGGAPIAAEVEVSPAEAYQKMIGGAG